MKTMDRTQIAELVQKAQAGDGEAMNRLLQMAYKNVLFQCRRIMHHPEDAEDMAQEVLLKIYETLGTLREPERFISWANAIATRRCINERTRNPKDLQFLEDEEGNSVLDELEELDQQYMPEAALDNDETRRMVRELIDQLPEPQRVAVMSYYNAEMSVKEIAELMPLLTSLWLLPSVFPSDKEGIKRKFRFLGDMLDKMGVPLMDDSIYALVEEFFEKMPDEPDKK